MTTSAIRTRLGADELYAIMLYATHDSIGAKFAVSQVCRLWRGVALDSAVLWSTFSVSTRVDAFRLPFVLDRTRRVRLSIVLDFTGCSARVGDDLLPTFDADDRVGIYQIVSPHMPRIRALVVDFGRRPGYIGSFEPLEVLFEFGIPYMEDLSIHWRAPRWVSDTSALRYRPVSPVRVSFEAALRLRSLRLTNIAPDNWSDVVVPTLEVLEVDTRIRDPEMLRTVLQKCPNLSSLMLCPTDNNNFRFNSPAAPLAHMSSLQSIHLGMPFATIWSVLLPVVDPTTVMDIAVTIPGNEWAHNVRSVYDDFIRGFGPVISCLLHTTFSRAAGPTVARFDVCDRYSRTRRFAIAKVNPFREHVRNLWLALSNSEHGLAGIRLLFISRHVWLITSSIFRERCPANSIESLIVVLSEAPASDEAFLALLDNDPAERSFPCPVLKRLTFETDDDPIRRMRVVLAILHLVDHVDRSSPVELCVSGLCQTQWTSSLREELASRVAWRVCDHSSGCSQRGVGERR